MANETVLPKTMPAGAWNQQGAELILTPLDTANGNTFEAVRQWLLVAYNMDAAPQTLQVTSQPDPVTGRTGDISKILNAGEIRVFFMRRSGWADSSGFVLLPSGQNANMHVGIVDLSEASP